MEELACRAILVAGPSLENWGLEHSRAILRHQTTFSCVEYFLSQLVPHEFIPHIDTFPTMKKSTQSELVCESYASHKLTYHVDHHGTSGCHISPQYSCIWGQPCMDFQEDSRRSKTLSQLRLEEVKTLPLDGYQAMLNTRRLGGEGVPFFSIVFVPQLSRAPRNGILIA